MIKTQANSNSSKSKGQVIFEYIVLAFCLCVIAIRTTVTESPDVQSADQPSRLIDIVHSLSISTVIILSLVIWFVYGFCSRRFLYRFSAIEIGLCLFIIAAVVAGFAASNKRTAITDFVTLVAPILMAVLLVQILDSKFKIKLLLAVIAALGTASAYQCTSQLFTGNKQLIEFYKENPDEVLAQQNITPNTIQHWQFEHRLRSKDVSGFFTTSNSAGSFALLASFAGLALFIEKFRNRKSNSFTPQLIICGLGVAVIIFGLAVTRSKGAIAASLIAAAMFAFYLLFSNWLKAHKKLILIACLLSALAGGWVVVRYGIAHRRRPGGNSMLVRWQYWHASAQMYADHPLKGLGPGNFAHAYFRYKHPSAMEEVSDPHNFLLSILTQYGPLGLVGFLAMILLPLSKALFPKPLLTSTNARRPEPNLRKLAIPFAIVISASLLFIRPILTPIKTGGHIDVTTGFMIYVVAMIYAIFILYVAPMLAFAFGLWIFTTNQDKNKDAGPGYTCAALFCAVCGLLIHNLIDFAIFEPGVSTTFWAIIACLIALHFHRKSRPQLVLKPALPIRILMVAAALLLTWACLNYALVPPAKSIAKIRRANRAISNGWILQADRLLTAAAEDDPLSPTASSLNAQLFLNHIRLTGRKYRDLLEAAEDNLLEAIKRDNAYFKNFEQLTQVYASLAEISTGQERARWLNEALDTAGKAINRYPGCARLRLERANIAQQLGKTDLALADYQKAIKIEDGYQQQFRQMYPKLEIFSRLGNEKYRFAKQKIKQLSKQPAP